MNRLNFGEDLSWPFEIHVSSLLYICDSVVAVSSGINFLGDCLMHFGVRLCVGHCFISMSSVSSFFLACHR